MSRTIPLDAEGFQRLLPVSRETLDRLRRYVDLLRQWNARINLVSAGSLGDVWRRHILDSAQLLRHCPREARVLVDLGSGAGLPGLILAMLGALEVHLIESDQRKAAFLREAARVTNTDATVHSARIEEVAGFPADIVTARALAPLPLLLDWAAPFATPRTVCLFPKGASVADELTAAQGKWIMRTQLLASESDRTGRILRVEELCRAPVRSPGPGC